MAPAPRHRGTAGASWRRSSTATGARSTGCSRARGPDDEDAAAGCVRGPLTQQHRQLVGAGVPGPRAQQPGAGRGRAGQPRHLRPRGPRDPAAGRRAAGRRSAPAAGGSSRANRRAFEEVERLTAQLRALSWRTLRMQEDLQRSISRDLHDDFGQILTAVGMRLGPRHPAARRRRARCTPTSTRCARIAQETLDRIRVAVAVAAPRRARRLRAGQGARAVRRAVPAPDGHRDAIRFDRADRRHPGRLRHPRLPDRAGGAQQREPALGVAARRGCDCAATTTRSRSRSRIAGVGMAGDTAALRPDGGMGLVNMRERAELMGGATGALRRPPHGGLMVSVRVPGWQHAAARTASRRHTWMSDKPNPTCCSPTTTRWCARASGASSRTSPTSRGRRGRQRRRGDRARPRSSTPTSSSSTWRCPR